MTRYCHISIKYTLYFFQKTFVFSTNFIFLLLVSTTINAQFSDTIKFKLKQSKVLIVSKSLDQDEWGFEKELLENKDDQNLVRLSFSLGNMQLNYKSIINGIVQYNEIDYKKLNSRSLSINAYLKSFNIKKQYLKVFLGIGFEKKKLVLNQQELSLYSDTMIFNNSNQKDISKNILTHNYLTVPINLSWVLFPKQNKRLKTQFVLINHLLLTGKSKFHFTENNILNQQNIRNDFFNTRYYLDGNLTIIWNKIGIYFQTNFSKYSNLYKDLFNYSYGITVCI
jgi:hypothetical protein